MRLLLLLALSSPALAQWARDTDPGMARQMLQAVEEDLAKVLAGGDAAAFLKEHAAERIEAIKRFRNPELAPLFEELLKSDDWHLQHRALLVLARLGDKNAIDAILPLLEHPHRRLRERAAIALIVLWDGRKLDLAKLFAKEEDFHVKRCLEALARRIDGALPVVVLAQEATSGGSGGTKLVPYAETGGTYEPRTGNKAAPPYATRFVYPLLGWGEEEVADAPLRGCGEGHPGTDKGANLDGAGVYAATDGVVRSVAPGEIVVEHQIPRREALRAVHLHTGPVVFVEPGERVTPGQLLGTIGMGFSAENGGVFAHLEYRIGPPAPPAYDPERFLALWVDRTTPLLPALRPLHPNLRSAAREAEAGAYGKATSLATRARDAAEPGSEAHADAVYLLGLLASVPAKGIARARRMRDAGYPADALKDLEAIDAAKEIAAWRADASFEKALKGEPRVESAERRGTPDLLRKLLSEYGDTCLRPRIEDRLK
ncbi:MAG TPA: HEAT repeat domain-containing protein [Planctomycetota bacterium]|nr:HEAT repeat domain-containing protein [Planctomycetota bacterium]